MRNNREAPHCGDGTGIDAQRREGLRACAATWIGIDEVFFPAAIAACVACLSLLVIGLIQY
jgi:hypothetical protein